MRTLTKILQRNDLAVVLSGIGAASPYWGEALRTVSAVCAEITIIFSAIVAVLTAIIKARQLFSSKQTTHEGRDDQ